MLLKERYRTLGTKTEIGVVEGKGEAKRREVRRGKGDRESTREHYSSKNVMAIPPIHNHQKPKIATYPISKNQITFQPPCPRRPEYSYPG